MKEITTTDSFIGGSSANMDWANEGYGGKKAKKSIIKKTTKKRASSKPKAKRASSKKKPVAKKPAPKKRAVSKKKGGALQHISSSPVPGPKPVIANGTDDFTTEQRIMAPIDVWSLSPPGLYTKYKIAKDVLGRRNVFPSTAEDEQGLQDMAMKQNEIQGEEDTAQENIYNTTVTPAQRARFNGEDVAEEAGEDAGDIAGEEAGDIAGEVGEFGDAADVIEGLGEFLGMMFGAGKSKNKKRKVLKKRNKTRKPTKAQWKKKKAATIKKVAKNKKLMKKVGRGFLDFLKSIPDGVDDAFVQIHNVFTGDKPASYQPSAWQRSDWNTWGLTQNQIDADVASNPLGSSLDYAYRHQVHHPQYQRDVWAETAAAQGGASDSKKREKTEVELRLAEANKMMKEAKRRFDTAVRDYYTDMKRRIINENHIDTSNKDVMKDITKYISAHKKAGVDKLKTRIAWATHNAYADELEEVLRERPQFDRYMTGLGKTTTKKKTVEKKKASTKPKAKKTTKKKAPAKKKTTKKK